MADLRIIQITDLHIGSPGERPREVNVRGNFERVLESVRRDSPDHIVISGDLSFRDGDREAYRYVRELIDQLDVPYSVIGGNHDISVNLAEEFDRAGDLHGDELFYSAIASNGSRRAGLILLDTVKATVSDHQLTWLRNALQQAPEPALLFMHHPPMLCDCRYMDSHYPFTRTADIVPVLTAAPQLSAVFCGHYHAEAKERLPGRSDVMVHVTPSLWFQIDRQAESMVVSDRRVGYCVIDVAGKSVHSRVEYLDPAP